MGSARHPGGHARPVWSRTWSGHASDRYLHHSPSRETGPMTFTLGSPLVPEVTLFVVAVVVLIAGLINPSRAIGWITFAGLLAVLGVMHFAKEGALFNGTFVQDELA